uniref:Potassium channel domain-containing protein n=1 Tax=Loa loa TaxID=7209 RepID=A0A1I7VXB5_LOALO
MHEIFHCLQQAYRKFHLNNFLPFIVLISYTLIGAAIFRKLELELDLRERELFRRSYNYAFNQITKRILELRCDDAVIRHDQSLQVRYAEEAVNWFLDYTNLTGVIRERNASSPWSWYGSMFYAGQLYTTIGYGLPVAKTLAGQIASIFYIMFGIPIFLIILKDVGRLLSRSFRKFYKRSRSTGKKFVGGVRKISVSMKTLYNRTYLPSTTGSLHSSSVKEVNLDPEVGTLMQQSTRKFTHENAFSIPIALAMLILWIGFSAALFCLYEPEWGYLTSVYFFFVSISTVGLGDIVPGNKDMMLGYFLLILIGLALLSMCINLIQVALEKILGQLLQEYIDEIERVAAIAKKEVDYDCKIPPFEVGMASGLLTVPLEKQHKAMRSLPKRFKEWIAERIANNMIESQLAEMNSDIESESEMCIPFQHQSQEQQQQLQECRISPEVMQFSRPTLRRGDLIDYLWKHIPAIRTVQALEKAKFYTPNDNFQSMLFSKFVGNSKLEQFMDQVCQPIPHTHHATTQTDIRHSANIATFEEDIHFSRGLRDSSLIRSDISHQSTHSLSNAFDVESVLSDAFCDIEFTEACALLATSDDSTSICASTTSNQIARPTSRNPVNSASEWKSKWKQIPRNLRTKSYHDTTSSYSGEGSTTALLPPLSNIQLSQNRIGSLPSSFQRSSLQSIPSLFLRKHDDEL